MIKMIQKMRMNYFRGLVDEELRFPGEKSNLLLLGGNGKGKSSIVSGLEWVYSGTVPEVVGQQNSALRHIDTPEDAESCVELDFGDGDTIRRVLDAGATVTGEGRGIDILESTPPVTSFILKRSKLIDFIKSAPATRYQSVMGLLGFEWLNEVQAAFNDTSKHFKDEIAELSKRTEILYAKYTDPETKAGPESIEELKDACNGHLDELGIDHLPWPLKKEDLDNVVDAVTEKRNPENHKRLTVVTSSLELLRPDDTDAGDDDVEASWADDYEKLDEVRDEIRNLEKGIGNAGEYPVIKAAREHLGSVAQIPACPVCERGFDHECSQVAVVESLQRREAEFEEYSALMKDNEAKTKALYDSISSTIKGAAMMLKKAKALDEDAVKKSVTVLQELEEFLQDHLKVDSNEIECPDEKLAIIGNIISGFVEELEREEEDLSGASPQEVEACFQLVSRFRSDHPKMEFAVSRKEVLEKLSRQAEQAKESFTNARKEALQTICNKLAGTVKDYYDRIHVDDHRAECSECTAIFVKPEGAGQRGSMQFKVDFFDTKKNCDPRNVLSEGHLDSLGLCIYLASVKLFNPPNSMLVIDDVLTSVDQDHRHAVTDILIDDFSDYQMILTTHDQVWYHQLKRKISQKQPGKWVSKEIGYWTREEGPMERRGELDVLKRMIAEGDVLHAGGPLRHLLEGFCQDAANATKLAMPYRIGGEYTGVDFIEAKLNEKLKVKSRKHLRQGFIDMEGRPPTDEELDEAMKKRFGDAFDDLDTVFAAAFWNDLVHRKLTTVPAPEPQVRSTAEALIRLVEFYTKRLFRRIYNA